MSPDVRPFDWTDLISSATARVAAAPRDKNAALDVLEQSAVALRDLLGHDQLPDPERKVYLAALLVALEAMLDGAEPRDALHLAQQHRRRDEGLFGRDFLLFMDIGRAVDARLARGHTRGDKPVEEAKKAVAKASMQNMATIEKVWSEFGAQAGWQRLRDGVLDQKEG